MAVCLSRGIAEWFLYAKQRTSFSLDLMILQVWYSSEVNLKVEFDSFPKWIHGEWIDEGRERARQATSSASAVLREYPFAILLIPPQEREKGRGPLNGQL